MSIRVRNITNMFISLREFNGVNSNDYRTLPDAAINFAIIAAVIVSLENYLADQASGARGQAVELLSVLIQAARRKMMNIAVAARALNLTDAGFRRLFSVPDGDGAQETVAAGREFVEEGLKHKTELGRLGVTEQYINELDEDLDDINAAVGAKAGANTAGVGATAGLDSEIERGMAAAVFLDAMMKNVYHDNPIKLAEWKSARHIRRAPRTSKPKTPPENKPTE